MSINPTAAETGSVWGGGNPFSADVCAGPLAVTPGASVEGLNEEVLDQLLEAVEMRAGAPLMLLTAPRAGYGKTHLLGRVVAAAGGAVVMVPLAFRTGDALNLTTVTRRGLEALGTAAGETEGWSRLREGCAGLVAHLLHELIKEGLVPSANPEQALRVLSGPVGDVFNADGAAHMIGDWLRKHAGGLRPILARRVSRQVPVRTEVADAWLEAMLGQAFEGGAEGLAPMQDLAAADRETGTPVWLRMLGMWRPVVLLVDHLDGYYRNPDAGVTIASLLMDLVDTQELHVLLSLNQDVWQATFGHHLPSALEDRLTASQVLLRGLREADAAALLRLRLERAKVAAEDVREFEAFVDVKQYFLGRPIGSVAARVFLRHCARQWEIFQNSVPLGGGKAMPEKKGAEGGVAAAKSDFSFPVLPTQPAEGIPLMTETLPLEAGEEGDEPPSLFDAPTCAQLQQMAETLKEPRAALPQNEAPELLPVTVNTEVPEPESEAGGFLAEARAEIGPEGEPKDEGLADKPEAELPAGLPPPAARTPELPPRPPSFETSLEDTGSEPEASGLPPDVPMPLHDQQKSEPDEAPVPPPPGSASDWRVTGGNGAAAAAGTGTGSVTPSADAFVKLREMLHHLRQPGARSPMMDEMADMPPERMNLPAQPVTAAVPIGAAAAAGAGTKPVPTPVAPARPGDALLGRFEALRLQINAEAESQPLDYGKLADLIRLAGRRFPLVRFSEHELPGLTGRQTMVWSIQGVELLFGLAPFSDSAYWSVLAGFAAGRITDLAVEAEQNDARPSKLKLVTFKSDREHGAWQALYAGETIPTPLKPNLDAVHLDGRSVAALYAMQRIIKDAESGAVQAEPTQVMTVLARELDFFWKRITKA
ncbi:hypothetical protein WJU23_04105 [Prosthecobacter sp. SYSU 5D2]|uniref:hypothetical protein n=1 Tax=Prosthecobacter sp. SYSU 5D2 TaxID=3134134 RepID=UPI0031FE5A4F